MLVSKVTIISLYFFLSSPCEPVWDNLEVNRIIETISNKLSIDKIHSFYCEFTVIIDAYFLPSKLKDSPLPEKHESGNYKIAWTKKWGKNYFLFESPTLEINTLNSDNRHQLSDQDTPDFVTEIFYLYKDNPYYYWFRENNVSGKETIKVRDSSALPSSYFLLRFFGQIGKKESTFPLHQSYSLISFLKAPGPFYLIKEEDYIRLWHHTYLEEGNTKKPFSLEIWLDTEGKIYRIDLIDYYSRIMDKNIFSKTNYKGPIDCNNPHLLIERVQIDEYYKVSDELFIPIKGSYETYFTDIETEEGKKLEENYQRGIISDIDYHLALTKIPRKINYREEIIVMKDTLKINQKISLDIFKPPDISSWEHLYEKNKIFIFSLILFIIIISILMSFIKKYELINFDLYKRNFF